MVSQVPRGAFLVEARSARGQASCVGVGATPHFRGGLTTYRRCIPLSRSSYRDISGSTFLLQALQRSCAQSPRIAPSLSKAGVPNVLFTVQAAKVMGPPHPSRDGDGAGLDRLGAIEAVPDVRPADRPRVDRTSWRSRSTARSPTGVALSSSTPWSASTVSCAAACAKPAGRSTCHEPSRSECCRWCGHAKANWANRFNDRLGPRSADPSCRRRSKASLGAPPLGRWSSATQPSHPADSRDAARCQAPGRVVNGRRLSPSAPASGGERGGQLLGGAAGAKHRACPDVARAQIPPTPRGRCFPVDVGR